MSSTQKILGKSNLLKQLLNFSINCFFQFFTSIPALLVFTFVIILIEDRSIAVFNYFFGSFVKISIFDFSFYTLYSLATFFILPFFVGKMIFRLNWAELCLDLPKNKKTAILLTLSAILILIPWIILFAKLPQFQGYTYKACGIIPFIFIHFILFPIYYFGEEFFFRGFLFILFWKKVKWHSFWITDVLFTLSHIGKPFFEILMCIPVSIILNYLTLKTRSIYPAMIVHLFQGILLSMLVSYHYLKIN